MKSVGKLIIIFAGLILFLGSGLPKGEFETINYYIKPNSTLSINGKTNINSFCCLAQDKFNISKAEYNADKEFEILNFEETKITIRTNLLDCGVKSINKDLKKTLMADEYPHITIELKQAFNQECFDLEECDKWYFYDIKSDITIVCTSKAVHIPVKLMKLDIDQYRIVGNTSIQLCDFGVEAPTALLGLIKVKDEIEINFDLDIELI